MFKLLENGFYGLNGFIIAFYILFKCIWLVYVKLLYSYSQRIRKSSKLPLYLYNIILILYIILTYNANIIPCTNGIIF